jgi:hypothetical protein
VLIMHASEADNGNALQKQIAKLAITKLGPGWVCQPLLGTHLLSQTLGSHVFCWT